MLTPIRLSEEKKKQTWTPEESSILREDLGKIPIQDIAAKLHRSENAVKLYMARNNISLPPVVPRNLLKEMLSLKLADIECFTPTKKFYQMTGLSQKRYGLIYRGEVKMTNEEYMKVATFLKVTLEEGFNLRQLNLFE